MALISYTRNDNGTYGPTDFGNLYYSKEDHRKTAARGRHKTRWTIEEGEEFHIFKVADDAEVRWYCSVNQCLFSVINDCKFILGENGERIAKFPQPPNEEAWHGYPVQFTGTERLPSDDLLDRLVENKIISQTTMRRIERRKL